MEAAAAMTDCESPVPITIRSKLVGSTGGNSGGGDGGEGSDIGGAVLVRRIRLC